MQRSLAHHFTTMAYNNEWANHRLLSAALQLSQVAFRASTRTSFFPSICATLNHNLTVDWLYVDALERAQRGEPENPEPGRFFQPAEPFTDCGALMSAQREVDGRLITLSRSLDDVALEKPVAIKRATGIQRESTERILAHLFQHQIHHRGQAHAMLAGTGVAPPQLDEFFCANEAHLRAADLAALGRSEDEIWATSSYETKKT